VAGKTPGILGIIGGSILIVSFLLDIGKPIIFSGAIITLIILTITTSIHSIKEPGKSGTLLIIYGICIATSEILKSFIKLSTITIGSFLYYFPAMLIGIAGILSLTTKKQNTKLEKYKKKEKSTNNKEKTKDISLLGIIGGFIGIVIILTFIPIFLFMYAISGGAYNPILFSVLFTISVKLWGLKAPASNAGLYIQTVP